MALIAIVECFLTVMAGEARAIRRMIIHSDAGLLVRCKELKMAVIANKTLSCMDMAVKDYAPLSGPTIEQHFTVISGETHAPEQQAKQCRQRNTLGSHARTSRMECGTLRALATPVSTMESVISALMALIINATPSLPAP
jgi:hypothetical protein